MTMMKNRKIQLIRKNFFVNCLNVKVEFLKLYRMGEREIPKPLVQSVMWVLTDKKEYLSLSPEKTYGEVLTLLDDPDYRREREHGRFY